MAIGKVVFVTRGTGIMDRDSRELFITRAPRGWQVVWTDISNSEQKLIEEFRNAEYLIAGGLGTGRVEPKLIENAKKLKLIQAVGQGTEQLPVKYALEKGIYVANAGGANANAVAEYTLCAILNCMKRVLQYYQGIREGKFRLELDRRGQHELYDKTVGIVGFGNIGRRVAKLCFGFGANIIYYERLFIPYALRADVKATPVTLDELLRQADVVTIHVPSFTANRKLIGYEELCKMKPSAYLINTSRGANIDETALIRALNEKKIAGAALDVWDPEPPDPKNPLLNMPNVVATPHMAGSSWENRVPSYDTIWGNITLVSEGKEPLNLIREF